MERDVDSVGAVLAARVAAMRARGNAMAAAEIAGELETIRRLAIANGYGPVLPVVRALDHVLARQTRAAPIDGWLAMLGDAIGCGNRDPRAEATFAALCSVRLGC